MECCGMDNTKPISELRDMMSSDVPMAVLIDSLTKFTKTGIIRKPPPAPIKPVSVPVNNPSAGIRK